MDYKRTGRGGNAMTRPITKGRNVKSLDNKGIIRESGADLIDLEERSIRERVRMWKPADATKFADELVKKKCYSSSHKRMVQVITSELTKMQTEGATAS